MLTLCLLGDHVLQYDYCPDRCGVELYCCWAVREGVESNLRQRPLVASLMVRSSSRCGRWYTESFCARYRPGAGRFQGCGPEAFPIADQFTLTDSRASRLLKKSTCER